MVPLKALVAGPLLALARRLVSGKACTCPVCNMGLRFFLPFGVGLRLRRSALCPECQSLERHRLAWLSIEPLLQTQPLRLLHVAPEACFESRLRQRLGASYVTVDAAAAGVDLHASVEALPFDDQAFGAVICNHVLEHVAYDRRALAELFRVLARGGWALLQVPIARGQVHTLEDPAVISKRERRRLFGQHDHVRAYGYDYVERVRAAGFVVEGQRSSELHDATELARYGLDPDEMLFFCRKPEP